MQVYTKTFQELSLNELYEILQLRSEVFVVEQDCVYLDIDGKDKIALHVLGIENEEVIAYTRIFKPGNYFDTYFGVGRVAVKQMVRQHGYGKQIMEYSIQKIIDTYGNQPIYLSAQTYLIKFYESLGFRTKGASYLEDGIPHIGMLRDSD